MKQDSNKPATRVDSALLPCLPHILSRLLPLSEADAASPLNALGDDPGLAARVLAIASARGITEGAASLAAILAALGDDTGRIIVRNSAIQQVFSQYGSRPVGALKRHWWRAMASAYLAERLALENAYLHPEEARLAGLVSAMGPLALWSREGEPELPREEGGDHQVAQRTAVALAEEWRLHPFVVDALRYRDAAPASLADAHPLVRIVHLAANLADYLTDGRPFPLDAGRTFFAYDAARLDALGEDARTAVEALAQRYGIEFPAAASDMAPGERRRHRAPFSPLPAADGDLPSDTHAKLELAREVRDLALLDRITDKLAAAQGEADVLAQVAEGAQLLFGLGSPLVFLAQSDGELKARPLPAQPPRATELCVRPGAGPSVAARSADAGAVLNAAQEADGTVLDKEIASLLGAPAALYVPLMAAAQPVGLAAFGIEPAQWPRLAKQQRLLLRFGQACAAALRQRGSTPPDALPAHARLTHLQTQARRVVHEINNPLAIMKNYLKLLGQRLEADPQAREDIRILNEEIDRIATLVRSLCTAPTEAAPIGLVDVNQLIRDLVALTEASLLTPAGIAVHTDLAPALPPLALPRDKLKQILLNLMKNAAEAMAQGGTLTLSTHDDVNRDGQSCVEIRVADTGPGLPREVLEHLFEPVTSTKGEGHAGLGLAIVKALVEEIGASITCISTKAGITFQLLLPKKAA